MHTLHDLITSNPTAAWLAVLGLILIAAGLFVRAIRKFRQGDSDFDPLATTDQPARGALDNKPWWRTMPTIEPRPSYEGTGTPRPDPPCAACGRHFSFGGCDTCKAHAFSEFLALDPGPPPRHYCPDCGLPNGNGHTISCRMHYDPATDVSHSNIGPGIEGPDDNA